MNFCAVEIITSIVTLNGISVPDESLESKARGICTVILHILIGIPLELVQCQH
jgi:hypothetical protein